MSKMTILNCPITNQQVIDSSIIQNDIIEYSIEYNKYHYALRIDLNNDLDISPEEFLVLRGMLYNNEWPIDKETLITKGLISQIIKLGDYPRSFNDKLNYYLLKCYLGGGNEYKPIQLNVSKYLVAYGKDEDEFNRIVNGLNSKELILLPNGLNIGNKNFNVEFYLTELGVKLAEQLKLSQTKIERYSRRVKPKITIFATKEDSFYSNQLKELLLDQEVTVSENKIGDEDGFSVVTNSRSDLYSEQTDYIIFIKSKNSDKNNSYGSILDIAIEAHENTEKRNYNYLYFAFIDDDKGRSRPRIDDYNQTFYDFRISTNRKLLFIDIKKDWLRRHPEQNVINSKYQFPIIELAPHEEIWLKAIYQKFLNNEQFQYRHLLSKMWDNIPKDFEPNKLNPLLARFGHEITLFGIWTIDPTSNIFEHFDKIVYAIRDILKNNGEVREISTDEIISLVPNISFKEIHRVFRLLSQMTDFTNSIGGNENNEKYSIGVNTDQIYRKYRNYQGIEHLIDDLIKNQPNSKVIELNKEKSDLLNTIIDIKSIHSHKTNFIYRDTDNIKAVMGVTELSSDLAEIIHTLPIQKEKGQMIGIFGKWGRGKTFLLKELWNILDKKENKNKKIYTKIEYHAWKYQETPASWAYLYEKFVTEFLGEKKCVVGRIKYYWKLLKLNYERLGIWPIIKFGLILIAAIATPLLSAAFLKWYFSIALIPIILATFLTFLKKIFKEFSTKATDLIKLYNIRHSFKEALGIQADIQDELIKLLKVWIPKSELGKKKILLIVEDIDRCTEERVIENIDALRIMLEDEEIYKRVIIITAIDERILKNAIRIKYNSIIENNDDLTDNNDFSNVVTIHELTSEYLDKLFISAIKLGGLTSEQREEYINELLEQEYDKDALEIHLKNNKLEEKKADYRSSGMSDGVTDALLSDPSYIQMQEVIKKQNELFSQIADEPLDMAIQDGDFVEKDGDIALQRSNGDITSGFEIETTINDRVANQNKFEKLSPIEVELIRLVSNKWESATPRRIRIFYYRYLLCKNLLINKYTILKRVNVWQNRQGISAMMNLILKYTKAHNPDFISMEKNRILSLDEEKIVITINDGSITSYRKDYLFLLEAMELVIAY